MKIPLILSLLGTLIINTALAQTHTNALPYQYVDSSHVKMAAGAQFKASGGKQFFWGRHYRPDWTTPVSFPILNVDTIYGGLNPVKMGGGHQTKTLRLRDASGKEYVLRTIDKNLDLLIPRDFKGTVIEDIVNDQISTAHPYGPLAISEMAGGINIMHTNPVIYFVPDSPRLGEFRPVFANKLCLLEERPSGKGWDHTALTQDAKDILNTEDLLEKILKDNKNQVDQQILLKVRLFDMIVNDWDRHEDQWVWTAHENDNKTIYRAFARDRDQAFSKTDGVALWYLRRPWVLRSLQHMKPTIKDVIGSNMAAKTLDRQFLNELTREEWQRQSEQLKTELTDPIIDNAVAKMPKESVDLSGEFVSTRLKQRRDDIVRAGMKYYEVLAKQVTITGSNKKETFLVESMANDQMAVTGLSEKNDTFYHRLFYRNETKEINIYGLGGDDAFQIKQNARNRFRIRLIGGEGEDVFQSNGRHGKKIRVYDSLGRKLEDRAFCLHQKPDTLLRYNRTFKYDVFAPIILPEYNPDDGVFLALGFSYRKHKWGKGPFAWEQKFVADYAFATGAFGFRYDGLFKHTFGKWDLDITSYYNGPRFVLNYYGLGNNTELLTRKRAFYRVRSKSFYLNPAVSLTNEKEKSSLRLGLQFETVDIPVTEGKFITSPFSDVDPSVYTAKYFGGVNGKWRYTTTGSRLFPTKGVTIDAGFSFLQNLKDNDRRLLKLESAISVYHTLFKRLTFAHRSGIAGNIGDYEFYQANTLGNTRNLRGWWRDRFAGTTAFYQNTELRYTFLHAKGYLLRGQAGIFGFFDDGRVWLKGENSNEFHIGYGGGIYFIPFNVVALSLYLGRSSEETTFNIKGGLFF